MTRDEFKAMWRMMTPAQRRREAIGMVADGGAGLVLIVAVAAVFKFLPAITAATWALVDLVRGLA